MRTNSVKNSVVQKIKNGEIKMKPRWIFETWNKTLMIMILIAITIAAIKLISIISFFEIYKLNELEQFGEVGRSLFFSDFPYSSIILLITGLLLATTAQKNLKDNYKIGYLNILSKICIWIGVLAYTLFLISRSGKM